MYMHLKKVQRRKYFFVGALKVNDENSRIRIRAKISWIRKLG
jgi:hypothetical protein